MASKQRPALRVTDWVSVQGLESPDPRLLRQGHGQVKPGQAGPADAGLGSALRPSAQSPGSPGSAFFLHMAPYVIPWWPRGASLPSCGERQARTPRRLKTDARYGLASSKGCRFQVACAHDCRNLCLPTSSPRLRGACGVLLKDQNSTCDCSYCASVLMPASASGAGRCVCVHRCSREVGTPVWRECRRVHA